MSTQLSSEELDGYRVVLRSCREAAVATADGAIQAIMAQNRQVLARVDAAIAEVEPKAGESASDHRRRIEIATATLYPDNETRIGGD